jgi:hypothetical protein
MVAPNSFCYRVSPWAISVNFNVLRNAAIAWRPVKIPLLPYGAVRIRDASLNLF